MSILCCVASSALAGDNNIAKIRSLRHRQLSASCAQAYACEDMIARHKSEYGGKGVSHTTPWLYHGVFAFHVIPFIVWQLLLLASLLGAVYVWRGLWPVVCLAALGVAFGMYERSGERYIAPRSITMRYGPASWYPPKECMPYLQEGDVIKKRYGSETSALWYLVKTDKTMGWVCDA